MTPWLRDRVLMASLSPAELALIFIVMAVGATVQGSVGLGMGLVATPVLVLINDRFVPAAFLTAAQFLTVMVILRDRTGLDFRSLSWALAGRLVGSILAAAVIVRLNPTLFAYVFGGLLLLLVFLSAAGLHLQRTRPNLIGAGIVSGITGTLTGIGGPPVALVYQDAHGARLRSTLAAYFLVGVSISLALLWFVGEYGMAELKLACFLAPGVLVGFLLSTHLAPLLGRQATRWAVLGVSGVGTVVVIVRTVMKQMEGGG